MRDGYVKTALLMAGLIAFCGLIGLLLASRLGMALGMGSAAIALRLHHEITSARCDLEEDIIKQKGEDHA